MSYKIYKTNFNEVHIIEPNIFNDSRGFFYESYNKNKLLESLNLKLEFVQDNHSRSKKIL